MRYRRAWVSGGTFFFTLALHDRSQTWLTDHISCLRNAMRSVQRRHPFEILAVVVLPDHLHALWRLPDGDCDFAVRWSLIKSGFSRQLPRSESISLSRHLKRERGIWQRRYWEHRLRDQDDVRAHIDYIHFNPVKHGYVQRASDWPYSSIHRFIRQGVVGEDWAG